ncbi:hypothetical protein INR49_015064, partial [Caranx melampygus]
VIYLKCCSLCNYMAWTSSLAREGRALNLGSKKEASSCLWRSVLCRMDFVTSNQEMHQAAAADLHPPPSSHTSLLSNSAPPTTLQHQLLPSREPPNLLNATQQKTVSALLPFRLHLSPAELPQ